MEYEMVLLNKKQRDPLQCSVRLFDSVRKWGDNIGINVAKRNSLLIT